MYTGTVWGLTLLIAGFLATLISFELLLAALAPAPCGFALIGLQSGSDRTHREILHLTTAVDHDVNDGVPPPGPPTSSSATRPAPDCTTPRRRPRQPASGVLAKN